MRPPTFEFGEDDGPAHNKQFTCQIKFGQFTETGTGRTKKLAKRNAANLLLASLKTNVDFLKENSNDKIENKLQSLSKDKNKKNGIDFCRLKQSTNLTITQLLNNSNNSLKEEELNKSFFEKLAKEENFEYNFFRVPKNKAGK